jgi:hypothetical protein
MIRISGAFISAYVFEVIGNEYQFETFHVYPPKEMFGGFLKMITNFVSILSWLHGSFAMMMAMTFGRINGQI